MSETAIQNAICEYLALKKHFFWRNNTTPTYDARRGTYRSMGKWAKKGVPDIIVVHEGWFIGLEVKQKGKYMSPEQKQFQKECAEAGGEVYTVRSIEDVKELGL